MIFLRWWCSRCVVVPPPSVAVVVESEGGEWNLIVSQAVIQRQKRSENISMFGNRRAEIIVKSRSP